MSDDGVSGGGGGGGHDGEPGGLRVRLLGPPAIEAAGRALTLGDHKAQALLFYLAVAGHACARDRLATLLWSESPESNAHHSLRSSLYHLRHALGAAGATALVVSRRAVRLDLAEDACDVARFRRMLAVGDASATSAAVALYRGPLLEGFSVADAPVFEDWLRAERAGLSRAYLDALDRMASAAETREAWGEAIDFALRIAQADPLHEAAQQRLMRLYLRSGATVRMLRQYRQFEAELKRELGLSPSPETQALLRRALRPRPQPGAPPGRAPTKGAWHGGEARLPFVGREEPLAELRAIAGRVGEGHGATVLLHGETGMGKTRLLGELAAALTTGPSAWTALQGACSPYDDLLSYGPFYEALQAAAPGDLGDLLAAEPAGAPTEAGTVMWRVWQALRLLAQGGPLLLAVEDLHWANSSTLQLFGFLATRLRNAPVLLLGTVYRGDAIPAVQRLVALGRPRGEVHLVPVAPLAPEAVGALLDALGLDRDAAVSLAEWVQARSGGSPFIVGEILAQLRAEGILTPHGAGWQLNEGTWLRRRGAFGLPATAYDLIAWRLAPLAPEALRLLEVLAVAGQPLPFALLRDLPGIQGEGSLQTADELLARGLLVETADGALALPHHLLRETLLARASQLRQRAIHRELLDAIERCPALQAHFPKHQVALHAVAAEEVERARRYGLEVLDGLLLDSPNAETLGFARRLHDLLAPSASPAEEQRLAGALGRLHQSLGELAAAARWRERQLEIARAAGDAAAQAAAQFEVGELALATSEYPAAAAAARAGLALGGTAAGASRAGLARRGHRLLGAALAMEGRDLSSAERHLQAAVSALRSAEGGGDVCAALFELGNVAAQRGDLMRALACYDEAGASAEAEHVYYYRALAHNNVAYHSLLLGRLDAAQRAAALSQRVAEAHELVGALLYLYGTLGEIRLYLADWAMAAEWFGRGLVLAEELGNVERQAGHRAGLALAARGEGHLGRATTLLEEALALIAGQGHQHLRTRAQLWLAEVLLERERGVEAAPHLEEALATAHTQGRRLLALQAERLRARLLSATDWPAANALFAGALRRATERDLALEAARTQAAWGGVAVRRAPSPGAGRALLDAARATFAALEARADLEAMGVAPRR